MTTPAAIEAIHAAAKAATAAAECDPSARTGVSPKLTCLVIFLAVATACGDIHKAAESGDTERVGSLLGSGADVNARNKDGRTPLHLAAKEGHADVAEALIKANADVNAKTPLGQTPIWLAAGKQGASDVVALLLANGADVSARGQGITPLMNAAFLGDDHTAKLLLSHGADVNAQNITDLANGQTPLMEAARLGRKDLVALLLRAGADVSIRDSYGQDALSHATEKVTIGRVRGKIWTLSPVEHNEEVIELLSAASGTESELISPKPSEPRSVGLFEFRTPPSWRKVPGPRVRAEFSSDIAPGLAAYHRRGEPKSYLDEFELFQKPNEAQLIAWTIRIPKRTNFLEEIYRIERETLNARRSQIESGECRLVRIGESDVVRTDVTLGNGARTTNLLVWSPDRPDLTTIFMLGIRPPPSPQTTNEFEQILSSVRVKAGAAVRASEPKTEQPPEPPKDLAKIPKNAKKTKSGLASRVLQKGTGKEHPAATSVVAVHYSGWTTDGKLFDSSVVRGSPATFGLDQVIPGWTEGLQLMVVGEERRLWIPEDLAYEGKPGRPQGMLVFDVELLEIKK